MLWRLSTPQSLAFLLLAVVLLAVLFLGSVALAQMESNDEPEILRFTFDEGLQGWTVGHVGGEYDSAEWSDDEGNPPGSVRLDGSDLGAPDGQPNAWMTKTVTLPATFDLLYFETRAEVDGALRVRLVDAAGDSHTLLDWEVLAGEAWRERTADIGPYAGQTVTLTFEQGDNDVGVGEHRYVDNITLCERAEPVPTAADRPASANCIQAPVVYLPMIVH